MFTTKNCQKAFEASGLVPGDAQVVLSRLDVRLRTPPGPPPPETPWESKTPTNTHEFGSQSKLISNSFIQLPQKARVGFAQLIKGAELMLHQNALQATRIAELEEPLEAVTKRKGRKRKWIQHGGTIEYGEGSAQVAAEASGETQRSKKARGVK